MEERGIVEEQVHDAIAVPDAIGQSFINRSRFVVKKIYWNNKFVKQHLLIIIYEQHTHEIFVVTVIDTSKIEKYYKSI